MGNILNLNCEKCNYNENFLLGAGLIDFDLEMALGRFDFATSDKINDWLKFNSIERYNLNIVLGFCGQCHRFEAVPTIIFYLTGKEPEKFIGKCIDGGQNTPVIVDYRNDKLLCPLCSAPLKRGSGGFWD